MLKEGTVFILGAAVSAEIGFPLGHDLKKKIRALVPLENRRLSPQQETFTLALERAVGPAWRQPAQILRDGLPLAASIDNLVEHRSDEIQFVTAAKLAIATSVGLAEQESAAKLRTIGSHATTYGELFKLMVSSCGKGRIADALQRAKFVTFNYDRSLEVFFQIALERYSGLTAAEARGLVAQIEIHHVYGSLGPAPGNLNQYGVPIDHFNVAEMAQDLRTFSEEVESHHGAALRQVVRDADRIVILGCAHHPRNMRILDPNGQATFKEIYGTQYLPPPEGGASNPPMAEFAQPAIQAFSSAILGWREARPDLPTGPDIKIEPLTSLQLVARYGSSWLD